jgi:hypothetical protein
MEPTQAVACHEVIDKRLGIPGPMAEADADNVDWHQISSLVQHGCPPRLALRIIR